MPFGMMSGVGRGMSVLDGSGDRRRGRGSFGGEFGASHCNNGDFVALLCESDALFPSYIGEDLLICRESVQRISVRSVTLIMQNWAEFRSIT